jgi:hypothetical protein
MEDYSKICAAWRDLETEFVPGNSRLDLRRLYELAFFSGAQVALGEGINVDLDTRVSSMLHLVACDRQEYTQQCEKDGVL